MSELKNVLTIGRYLKNKFGEKVYKIPISISGFTCPNIDGTVARGGCSFCENDSFSPNLQEKRTKFKLNPRISENPYLENQLKQLEMQFFATKKRLENKFGVKKFIVYFQSFTNTYAPFDTLKALYEKALSFDNVIGLSIGTRTDCMTDEILDFLVEKSKDKEIWIEYGIQSFFDETLVKINRGDTVSNMKYWIKRTKDRGLKVCGHLIYGLPNETQEMMLETFKQTLELEVDSIKFHPLYVVKNTLLTNDFRKGRFTPISEELYIDTVVKSIINLPNNVSVQRVTAGIDDSTLLSPQWCKDKHQQMKNIRLALEKEGWNY
ncbi:TIGR01212 family radical SAM protein [Aliarcobacter butzleri]|uniref:TIGR01212 family radical SAM protein n=1 Tax=Aliarcobacter butzleri TaxID=28197 RepID=A0AAW7Q3M0_9BACT|nr:TIGR01212 family radical SAM protein [Aliarcobacter butzleri]MCG3679073.1 TIGR01212 family radical SAM protein [Aliarcobacter butzleri]MCT7549698.1 TIGR01212 family radical SAM protein [Aliarcobacter butzleri]MCT7558799.1 TIGR01212 family radical SAM protein [Aliarcobacter butzleri]MCT7581468.1 TIGR01212 family radical SAM protein [Aliarcobacter butzleri]MCT7594588.1 TIGR01212 family radical SAM protein [Aliarcobacter butzleri]